MADDDFSSEIQPRRLPEDHSGEIADLRKEIAELRRKQEASRSGRGGEPGTPPGDKELAARVAALERFNESLEGQNGITVAGPIVSLDRTQEDGLNKPGAAAGLDNIIIVFNGTAKYCTLQGLVTGDV